MDKYELEDRKELISSIQPKILDMLITLGIDIQEPKDIDLILKTTEIIVDECINQTKKITGKQI